MVLILDYSNCTTVIIFGLLFRETAIYANVWAVMHNPMYWMDPENFRPERFLDESGNFQRNERCIPFMIGKRHCIGQVTSCRLCLH